MPTDVTLLNLARRQNTTTPLGPIALPGSVARADIWVEVAAGEFESGAQSLRLVLEESYTQQSTWQVGFDTGVFPGGQTDRRNVFPALPFVTYTFSNPPEYSQPFPTHIRGSAIVVGSVRYTLKARLYDRTEI